MDLFDAIKCRHSFRGLYEKTLVSRENLRIILEAGLNAPSGCNKQTTKFLAVDDPQILERIKTVLREMNIPSNIVYNTPIAQSATAIICVLYKKSDIELKKNYVIQDYSAAVENMLLALVALGYQSCWYEGCFRENEKITNKILSILNVPKEYRLACLLPIGIAQEKVKPPPKKDFCERAWFNCFGGEKI